MVIRRKKAATSLLAEWVTTFTPSAWPGVDIFRQWRAWQAAAREYLELHDLARLDITTWQNVTRHTYDVGRELRKEFPTDTTATPDKKETENV